MKEKREARVIRYYANDKIPTEDDYIECLITCWDEEEHRYYWGMTWRWDYKTMNSFAEYDAYSVADKLFDNLVELQRNGYKITFENKAI